MSNPAPSRIRVGLSLAATAALMIAIVFLTLGDGSNASADGWRGPVLQYGHALVWLLLAAGLGVAAVRNGGHRRRRRCAGRPAPVTWSF